MMHKSLQVAPMLHGISDVDFSNFLESLTVLISRKTVFYDDYAIDLCISYIEQYFHETLPAWKTWRDNKGNLICINRLFNSGAPGVFLSAHVDTVDANQSEWLTSDDPFRATETDTHIIGRGANDCKAGVAFMMLVAKLIASGCSHLNNVVFLFSFREEGNAEKTSTEIAKNIGSTICISSVKNAILCLENTVSISGDGRHTFGLYDREPCNVFASLSGSLQQLRRFFLNNNAWKPVFIEPSVGSFRNIVATKMHSGVSGHIATTDNADNVLYRQIMNPRNDGKLLSGGDLTQLSALKNSITIDEHGDYPYHHVIANCRDYVSISDIKSNVMAFGIPHCEFHHDCAFAEGGDFRLALKKAGIPSLFMSVANQKIAPYIGANPGRSDASALWNGLSPELKKRVVPFVIGPGSRSHSSVGILRKTHGPDEGFHKESGRHAIDALLEFIAKLAS